MNFDELLAHFKVQSRPEDAMVPILDPVLLMYAAAWQRVKIERTGEPWNESWEGLWDCVYVDVGQLAMLMDVPENKAAAVLRRLQALRVIYPDGSVPELVRKVIAKRVQDALKQDIR